MDSNQLLEPQKVEGNDNATQRIEKRDDISQKSEENDKITQKSDKKHNTTEKRRLPLTVLLEGKSWVMTAIFEATTALWMVALAADGDGLFVEKIQLKDKWQEKLLTYFLYILIGVISAAITVGALSVNFYPVEFHQWRMQSCRSVLSLMIGNFLAINHILLIIESICGMHENLKTKIASVPATLFLTIVGSVCTLANNWMFFREFGCCTCCRTEEFRDSVVKNSQVFGSFNDYSVVRAAEPTGGNNEEEGENRIRLVISYKLSEENEGYSKTRQESVNEIIASRQLLKNSMTKDFISLSKGANEAQLDMHITSSANTEEFTVEYSIFQDAEVVGQQENERILNECRSPFVNILSEDESTISKTFKTRSFWKWVRTVWDSLREEPGHFRYPVWIKSAVFTSAVVVIYSLIRSISRIHNFVDNYDLNRDRVTSNMHLLDRYLKSAEWEHGLETIAKFTLVKVILLIDVIVRNMKWTTCVGYPLGALFSLCGLINVLVQHKKMSIAVSNSFRVLKSQPGGAARVVNKWQKFQKKYPALGACFFLAILCSTAAIQFQTIGIVVSISLGILANCTQVLFIFEQMGPYFFLYVTIALASQAVFIIFKSCLLTQDQFHIKHPRWFNFCLVVLSMIHLLLGILYALWRVLYLVITTVLILNRLDVSLFTTGKWLDNGHNAFMSMLVLAVMIREDSDQYYENIKSEEGKHTV